MNNKSGSERGELIETLKKVACKTYLGNHKFHHILNNHECKDGYMVWEDLADHFIHLQKLCEEGEIERLDCEVKRSCQFVADTNLSHAHQIGEWKKEEVLWKEREANLLSQLATQTELTKAWKKKYEEYSAYCIALVDCEKEKATQTERIKELENSTVKVSEYERLVLASREALATQTERYCNCAITLGESQCQTWQIAEQAINQESLGDGK